MTWVPDRHFWAALVCGLSLGLAISAFTSSEAPFWMYVTAVVAAACISYGLVFFSRYVAESLRRRKSR